MNVKKIQLKYMRQMLCFGFTKWSQLAALNPDNSRYYVEGGRDYEKGVNIHNCPHPQDLYKMLEWTSGWVSARNDYDRLAQITTAPCPTRP